MEGAFEMGNETTDDRSGAIPVPSPERVKSDSGRDGRGRDKDIAPATRSRPAQRDEREGATPAPTPQSVKSEPRKRRG